MRKYLLSIKTDDGNTFEIDDKTLIQGWSYETSDEVFTIIRKFITQDISIFKDDYDGVFLKIGYPDKSRIHYIAPSKITSVEIVNNFFD